MRCLVLRCKITKTIDLLTMCMLLLATTAAEADLVRTDYLGGIGDFERSAETAWSSTYNNPDYDFDANNLYSSPYSGGRRWGYSLPTAEDSVALGWTRRTSDGVNPGKNIVYQISSGTGVGGSSSQFFGLKGIKGGYAQADLISYLRVNPVNLHAGDTVTFRVDSIYMSGYTDLPAGTTVVYKIAIEATLGTYAAKELAPSSQSTAYETSLTIPDTATIFVVNVSIQVQGDTGDKQPGAYVDGAHLYVRRAGSSTFEMQEVPVPKQRAIATCFTPFHTATRDLYQTASDYDTVILDAFEDYAAIYRLRYLNPNVKVYLGQMGVWFWDLHDDAGKDLWYNGSPMGFRFVKANHPEWLWPGGTGVDGYVCDPSYPSIYYARVENANYIAQWSQKAASLATRWGFDGIYADGVGERPEQRDAQGNMLMAPALPWQMQRFVRGVAAALRTAGAKTMLNVASQHFESGEGQVYFDPFWSPSPPYDSPEYASNTPAATPDDMHQENAFFRPSVAGGTKHNLFETDYWKKCLDDMDAVKSWNTRTDSRALASNQKRRLLMRACGYQTDPPEGNNGFLQFGLCSYLLGQNEWTAFAYKVLEDPQGIRLDLTITWKLGAPVGDHMPYNGDIYFQYRRYGPSVGGAAGGVVVVNAHPDSSRTFTLDFDGTDEQGIPVSSGQEVVLAPHTGRIFLKQKGPVFVRIRTPSGAVAPGEVITVTVDYLSSSTQSALNVILRAKVPNEMTYIPGSAEISGGSYDPATNTVSWKIGTVVAGHSGRRTFKARVK